MSAEERATGTRSGRRWAIPMRPRSPDEEHRAATPLELFFDLVFVVAIAHAARSLHHGVLEGSVAEAVVSYGMVFFAIWWAWMNFTWFASAYDTDDVPYRLAVFVQITGSLILAAGIPRAFEAHDFSVATFGYVVMRMALVGQWLRAARSDPERRTCGHRYALGVGACQVGWVALLFAPAKGTLAGFLALATAELLVPVWAERSGRTTWHPGHIAERYGLFTIIVLGESVLAASIAIQAAIREDALAIDVAPTTLGGLLIVFSMWWLYFERPAGELLTTLRGAFVWGYGHYAIFASAAAVGAGLGVVIDEATRHAAIGASAAGGSVAVPVAVYLLALWFLHERPWADGSAGVWVGPAAALLVCLTPFSAQPVLLTGLLLAALVALRVASGRPPSSRAAG